MSIMDKPNQSTDSSKTSRASSTDELSLWNDRMVEKYHKEGTLFESKNILLRLVERLRLRTMVQMAGVLPEDSVMDLGCGEGFLLPLIPPAKRIVGLDISRIALNKAEQYVERKKINAVLQFGDAQRLGMTETFDKIFCSEMLEHVPDPRRVMKNIYKALKPKGVLVASIPDERRVRNIVSFLRVAGLLRFLHAARKSEAYEWHLHEGDMNFIKDISQGLFNIIHVQRIPPLLGYRIIVKLEKK